MEKEKQIDAVKEGQEKWENTTLKKWLERAPEREVYKKIKTKRLYTPVDQENSDYLRDIGFPGEYPFTRGLNPSEFRSRLWHFGLGMGFGTPEETNKLYKRMFSKGSNRFTTKIDLPGQQGLDPDHEMADGEVGVIGTSIPSLQEMLITFDGIPMAGAAISGLIGATSFISWSMAIAVAKKQGVPLDTLSLNMMNDCLNEYIARSNYIFPPAVALRLSTDLTEYVFKNIPKTSFVIGCGYPIAESGAGMVKAVALMLACGLTNIDKMLERGALIDEIAPRCGFNIHVALDFFPEVAKFRALRRVWAKIMKDKYGAKKSSSLHFRFGPGTGGSVMTAQSPRNNIVRGTVAAMAAILGGAHSLNVTSYDEALAIPTDESQQIALATHQILAFETGIPDTVDPLGGSYYVEKLTDEIEAEIEDYLAQLEKKGGLVKVLESGEIRKEINAAAYARQREIDNGERIVVGVNKFVSREKPSFQIHLSDPTVGRQMAERVKKLRASRDNEAVKESLAKLQEAARGTENVIPYVIDAVENFATVQDITDALVEVFGRWQNALMTKV
jgi:methylmalonyl-CoA mutase N-terminal domain/subunit